MPGSAYRSLHFAARPRVVAHYTGQVLSWFAGLSVVPATVAWIDGAHETAAFYALSILVFAVFGWLTARIECPPRLQRNETLVVSALAFVLPSVALMLPLSRAGLSPIDAFFEAVSRITTTGLSTLPTIEDRPFSFLFARAWTQWVGGLGVIVLALAYIRPSRLTARELGFDERAAGHVVASTRARARLVLVVYATLTAGAWLGCWLAGTGARDALLFALSAISTGGFAPLDASLADLPVAARAAVTGVSVLGAISLFWFVQLAGGRWLVSLRDAQLWRLVALVVIGAGCVAGGLVLDRGSSIEHWMHGVWLSVSAQTTAGFSSADPADLPPFSRAVLVFQMLVGGHVGSTAGGLKILRFILVVKLLTRSVLRVSVPRHAELPNRLEGRAIEARETTAAMTLATFLAVVVGLSWLAFLAYGHAPLDALFDVASATGTVGLSCGVLGPDLAAPLKGVLCADMLLGRVEVLALVVLVFPGTWFGRRRNS